MNPSIQDALLTIHRNQAQIDLLTANNTQLVNYLLHMGISQAGAIQPQAAQPQVYWNQGVPDQTERPKRGRPRKILEIAAPAVQPAAETPANSRVAQWSPEARAKRAATFAAKKRKGEGAKWTPAQKRAIGERSRAAWARKREAEARPANGWGGKRVKGQKAS